jgi:hypothetical protein
MKKRLNADALMQEFQEGSAFFRKVPQPVAAPLSASQIVQDGATLPDELRHDTEIPRYHDTTSDTTVSLSQEQQDSSDHSAHNATTPLLERTRRAVKHLGKEAATYRFTVDEKKLLKKIGHEYALKGIRTSENEITRIAINYVMEEYRQHKDTSILARVLELLNN